MTLERYGPGKLTHPVGALIIIPFLPRDTGNMEEHRKSHLAKLNLYQGSDPSSFTQGWPKHILVPSPLSCGGKPEIKTPL